MAHYVQPFPWNHCPICGRALASENDAHEPRPYCARCKRFYYSNPVPAVCCFVTRRDELLLVKRAVEPCLGEWCLPGGFIEFGENTEEAAYRELEEETGLRGNGLRLIGASTKPSHLTGAVVVLGYAVLEWKGEPTPGSDALAVEFFTKKDRPPLAFEAHRELLALTEPAR